MITIYLTTENLDRFRSGGIPLSWSTTPKDGHVAVTVTTEQFNRIQTGKTILHG